MTSESISIYNEILGREIHIPDKPQRIVSFAPAITETLFELGAGDRVVGVGPFCARPQGEVRKKARIVGSYNTVNLRVLRELKPDLIFTVTGYQRDFAIKLASTSSEKHGIDDHSHTRFPVYPVQLPTSVSGIIDMVQKAGLVIGEQDRAWELSSSFA